MADRQEQLTLIGPDTLVRGEIIAQSAAYILGKVEGKILAQGHLQIGQGSVCKAGVQGTTIIIEGTVEGDVLATEKLELKPTALIKGDLTAAKLIVTEGAAFTGHCAVGAEAVASAQRETAQGNPQVAAAPLAPQTLGRINANRPAVTTNGDVDSALAGLEAKLAGFNKARAAAE